MYQDRERKFLEAISNLKEEDCRHCGRPRGQPEMMLANGP
jgi:hypothetical protein